MPYQDLEVNRLGAVMTIRLNRPERLNALRRATFIELIDAFVMAERENEVSVVVLTGSGRAFCAGADLSELANALHRTDTPTQSPEGVEYLKHVQDLTRVIISHKKITIAAINQIAVGFGAEIPLACNVRVMASDASITFPETTRGLCHTNGTYYLLPRLIGVSRTQHILFSGQPVLAADALQMGLVTAIYETSGFPSSVQAFANQLSERSPLSIARVKGAFISDVQDSLENSLKYETEGMLEALAGDDLREGIAAYHEKRVPNFTKRQST